MTATTKLKNIPKKSRTKKPVTTILPKAKAPRLPEMIGWKNGRPRYETPANG
tara:strand:- start:7552 stop:7707 length:156 start_codon:yes stop_codon:yes gene_type:complete